MSLTKPVSNNELDCVPAEILSTIGDDLGQDLNAIAWEMFCLSVVRVDPARVMACLVPDLRCV
jgi:hypothetical protein